MGQPWKILDYKRASAKKDAIISNLKQENGELKAEIADLRDQVTSLINQQAYHDGPHAPPSHNSVTGMKKKHNQRVPADEKKGRGGKKGHAGATSVMPKATKHKVLKPRKCRTCGKGNFSTVDIKRIKQYEIEWRPADIVQYERHTCKCTGCGTVNEPEETLPDGRYGNTVIQFATYMVGAKRQTFAGTSESLSTLYNVPASEPTVQTMLDRGVSKLAPEAEKYLETIKQSPWAGADESRISFDGESAWMWVVQCGDTIYVWIYKGRGKKALRGIFDDYTGVLCTDGHRTYFSVFKGNSIQRCYAHVIREAKGLELRGVENSDGIAHEISVIMDDALKWAKLPHTDKARLKRAAMYERRIEKVARRCIAHDGEMARWGRKLLTAMSFMFTFVIHPYVPHTNNQSERALREPVIWRKIHGQVKSIGGMYRQGILMTCFGTWRLRGLNPMRELRRLIA